MKEINKTIETVPLPLSCSKNLDLNTSLNPVISQLQSSNLSLVFSSPLIHKEKNKRISQEDTLSLTSKIEKNSPFGPNGPNGPDGPNREKESFNIFKEKETLKKIFSNQIEKQRKFNNNLDNYLGFNTKIHYFENLIFVKDKVQNSKSLTTLNNEKVKKEQESQESFGKAFAFGQIEKKDYYQLTLNINNYLFILSKFVMTLNSKSSIWKSTLFMPKRFLAQQPNVKYEIMLRSVKKTLVQKVKPRNNIETVTPDPIAVPQLRIPGPFHPTPPRPRHLQREVELQIQRNRNNRRQKLLILEKKLITNLLKQGINLILYLNILINQKKMDIKTLINLQNINSIDPALLEKISNIFIETKIFKSKLELELNVFELFFDLNDSPFSPYLGVELLSRVTPTTEETQNLSHTQPQEDSDVLPCAPAQAGGNLRKQTYGALEALGASYGGTSGEEQVQEQELVGLRIENSRKLNKSSKNEIFISTFAPAKAGVKENLEFETPELTKLPFSLLQYKNKNNKNKNNYPPLPLPSQSRTGQGYNNNLQLKTIPFSVLLNKNTVLEGKNAVKLSIVNSHFDLDKNNTRERDIVQTSALTSTASLSLVNGAENYSSPTDPLPLQGHRVGSVGSVGSVAGENSVHKPVISQYLKELSIYNIRNKGIIIFYYILIGFHFNTDLNKSFTSGKKTKNINKLLAASFKSMYCLISKPVFITTPDKIIVQLFYYLFIPNVLKLKKFFKYKDKNKDNKVINPYFNREPIVKINDNPTLPSSHGEPTETLKSSKSQILAISKLRKKKKEISLRKKIFKKQYNKFRKIKINVRVKLRKLSNISLVKVFPNKFKFLSLILNNIFKKPVVFDLVRIHYPYNDSNILVNLLGIMINKIKLRIIIRRFFEKAIIKNINKLKEKRGIIIPSFLSGLTIRVAGRLLTHKVVPRLTVYTTSRGASAPGRINFKDVATYTNKNKRGAYSITVKAGQNLF